MERLTIPHYGGNGPYMKCTERMECDSNCGECCNLDKIVDRLAYYEDTEEQGRLNITPYKVGQVVWVIRSQTSNGKNLYLREERIDRYVVSENGVFMCFESGRTSVSNWNWSKTVFLTREEAEQALKEGAE